MANKQHAQFSDENGNLFYLENQTEDVLDPSGKPLSDGGDLSEASVKFSVDTSRKLPQSGGRFKAFLGSIVKYLTDLGAAAYLAVANNDTTTQPGFVGDARVLKQHRDAINQLNSELSSLKASFQDGIKKIAGKLTSLGVPTSNTASPDTISNNIQTLYNNRYNEGISAAAIQTRDVVASTDNFGNYNDYNLTRSLKFNPPSLSGYRIVGAYIKKIYISNSNKAFGSGTFEIQKNGNSYYILSKDCNWPSGGTAVNATMTFIYQK